MLGRKLYAEIAYGTSRERLGNIFGPITKLT